MKVWIKTLQVDMEVKNNGIEFEVRSPDDKDHLGDLYVTKAGLTWCKGRISKDNGKAVSWAKFIEMMDAQ